MAADSPSWQERHDTIRQVLQTKAVRAALRDFQISSATTRHLRTASNDASYTSSNETDLSALALGKLLDISLVIAWSADGLAPSKDPNPFRAAAAPSLLHLRHSSLQVQDFKSIKVLQKSAGSLVEVVKNRLDGRVYVLKSLVKGFARRNAAIQTPINETKLLQRESQSSTASDTDQTLQLLTPQLLAAFQTQNSVHVLMEYVPSGDFSELLMAASNCGPEYPGRASTGLLTEDWILRYSVDMIQAIAWVHGQGFAHRDIKPGNFLLDRSGHLKLCDFSSAAPFSDFGNANTSTTANGSRRSSSRSHRKVWAFYCSQPTGTCDYLSPEVLEAEEKRVLELQRQCDMSSLDDILGLKRQATSSSGGKSVPEESPGMYGPEVDWWSFGVMLYEMRFGILPFFASRMEETYEKIKDHKTSLTFDPAVACSSPLQSLVHGLLTDDQRRLGRVSSDEVQQHGFYRAQEIDWSRQWPLQPPFTPNANVTDLRLSHVSAVGGGTQQGGPGDGIAARLQDESLSVVSSLPSFSALYNGNPDDFPAFADSREIGSESARQQQSWWDGDASTHSPLGTDATQTKDLGQPPALDATAAASDALASSMTRSSSSPALVLSSSTGSATLQDASSSNGGQISPYVSRSAPRWSDCDTTFVGFSYLPHRDAFAAASGVQEGHMQGEMSTTTSLEDLAPQSEASPNGWPSGTPVASTPFHRGNGSHSFTMLPTPPSFAASPVVPLADADAGQRPIANPVKQSGLPFTQEQNFVTPARKPSYMAMHDRFRQLQGQEAPIPEGEMANFTPAVPASPYPFPMASVLRTSKFTTGGKKPLLQHRNLDRARSETPGGGSVGSDSRQSGGSNAIREMSEREAWDEMMAAVQKSVRKKQPAPVMIPTPITSSAARPSGLPRSNTDPQLSASKPIPTQPSRRPQQHVDMEGPVSQQTSSQRALQPLEAPRQPTQRPESADVPQNDKPVSAVQPAGALRHRTSRATLIAPRATFKIIPPESPNGSPSGGLPNESPRQHAYPQSQLALDIDMYDSDSSDDSTTGRRNLRHKKSARQLLIRAQERGTPTKPKRAQSPPMTDAFVSAPSVAAVLEAAGHRSSPPIFLSDQSIRSCSSSRDISYEYNAGADLASASGRTKAMAIQRSGKASPDASSEALSASLGKTSVTFAPMAPILGAIHPGSLDGHGDPLAGLRESGRSGRTIRRKDSGEMLSQYRKAKGMGRATSMLSLSERAKADAEAPNSRPGTATAATASSSSLPMSGDGEDDFILGHVENRMRGLASGGSLPGRTIRRFSSVLSLQEKEKVTIERPSSQDGAWKSSRGFGRFKSRITSSTLSEELNEEPLGEQPKSRTDILGRPKKVGSTTAEDQQTKSLASKLGRKAGDTLPRSFGVRSSSATMASAAGLKKSVLTPTLESAQENASPGNVSLMTGLNHRHTALQGSLLGLEQRLARLKARLED